MLILSRHPGEETVLLPDGRQVRMTVLATKGTDGIRIGWKAPSDVVIRRAELEAPWS